MTEHFYPTIGETVFRKELLNGLRVVVLPRRGFHSACAQLTVNYGSCDRGFTLSGVHHEMPAGVAHFLEHKMFDMPDGSNMLQSFSAAGASANAYTTLDETGYYFSCTSGFTEHLSRLLRMVSAPYFTEESVQKEQGIIAQEISMGNDRALLRAYFGLLSSLYAAHPVRERIDGSVESISRITPEILYTCHRAFYRADNMVLTCVGDVEPERIFAVAEELLPQCKEEKPVRDPMPSEPPAAVCKRFTDTMSIASPFFFIGTKLPGLGCSSEDFFTERSTELLGDYLVGDSSPFYLSLYKDTLLDRNYYFEGLRARGTMSFLFGGRTRDAEQVYEAFLSRLARVREKGVDPARWERCIRANYGASLRLLDSFEATARVLAHAEQNDCLFPELYDALPTFSAERAAAYIRENFTEERMAMAVIEPDRA